MLIVSVSRRYFPCRLQRSHRHHRPGLPAGQRGGATVHDPPVAVCQRGDAGGHCRDHPGRRLHPHHL